MIDSLSFFVTDVPQTVTIGNAVTFNFEVKSAVSGYDVTADLDLCVLDDGGSVTTCHNYPVLPDVPIYAPMSQCSGKKRKKRAATTPK